MDKNGNASDVNARQRTSPAPSAIRWATVAQVAAAIGAVGGLLLHLIGATANQVYFEQWGLDSAMFPKATDLTIVLGYFALLESIATAVITLTREYWLWLLGYGLLLGAFILAGLWLSGKNRLRPVRGVVQRYQRYILAAVTVVSAVFVTSLAVPFVLVGFVLVLALPLSAGQSYGKKLVHEQLRDFRRGCDNLSSKAKCATLHRGADVVRTGFLIGAGEKHLALYDPEANRVVLVEREGLQLVGAPNWLAYPPEWSSKDIK